VFVGYKYPGRGAGERERGEKCKKRKKVSPFLTTLLRRGKKVIVLRKERGKGKKED